MTSVPTGGVGMPGIRGVIAASVDGHIAGPDGGIDWLSEFAELTGGMVRLEYSIHPSR